MESDGINLLTAIRGMMGVFMKQNNVNKRVRSQAWAETHFAYGLFFLFLMAPAFKEGVEIHRVNPAYTSNPSLFKISF